MGWQIAGSGGALAEVETNSLAMRTTPRPIDPLTLGEYRWETLSGTMAAGLAAAAPVFSFRWGNANLALVQRVQVAMTSLATGFAAGIGQLDLIIARAFSASDTGGTQTLPTGNGGKKRTAMGTTLLTDWRQSSTATLTAGTRTLDAQPISRLLFTVTTAVQTAHLPLTSIIDPETADGQWPLVLAQNEGFILRATVPATGTWQFTVNVVWDEVASYQ